MVLQILLSIFGLRISIIAGPEFFIRRIALVVVRFIVVVVALRTFPVIPSLPPLRGNKIGASMSVEMPLADVGRVITGRLENFGHTKLVRGKIQIVYKHAGGQRKTSGHKRRAMRRTNRTDRHCVAEIHRFPG